VPFSYLIVRWLRRTDLREVGSGNVGATNTLRAAGKVAALCVLALDVGKGLAPVAVARSLGEPAALQALAAAAAVLGHVFSPYLGLRGGKGVATAAGAFLGLSPPALLLTAAVFAGVLAWKRWVSLASLAAAASYPALLYAVGAAGWAPPPGPAVLATSTAIAALVILRHRANLGRLWRGEEPRLGESGRGAQ
jgi:glycerol-3-phosphate acyltransferase PlsY